MMKRILLFLCMISSIAALAQEAIPALVTDRPDQTESSSVVPLKSLQIETGFLLENEENTFREIRSFAYNTTLIRYGLLERLELRIGLEYLGDRSVMKLTGNETSISGFSPLYTGFKIKVTEESGILPEIAFLGGLVLPFTANQNYETNYAAVNMRFSMSHTLSDRFSIGYNLGVETDGISSVPSYYYSFVTGFSVTGKIGTFVESYGFIPETGNAEHLLDAGITYLLLPTLQLDFSAGIGISEAAIKNFLSVGLSYRIDKKS